MAFLRKNETLATQLLILLNILNFVCIAPKLSNIVVLVFMNIIGLAYFFLLYQRRLSKYALFFLLFVLYLYCIEFFYFGGKASFAPLRLMAAAFSAGMTAVVIYQRNLVPKISMLYPLPFLLLAGTVGFWLFCWLSGDISCVYHDNTIRVRLFNLHPFRYAMLLAVSCLVSMSVVIQNITAPEAYAPKKRIVAFLYSTPVACICFSLCFGLLILAQSRVALISCLAALAVCLLPGMKKLLQPKALAALATAALISGALYGLTFDGQERAQIEDRFIFAVTAPQKVGSFISRQALWECAVNIIEQHPLLGTGRASFYHEKKIYIQANYAQLTEKYGKGIIDNDTLRLENPHNQYVCTAVEHGLVGLAFFVLLLLYPIFYCIRHRTPGGFILPVLVYFAIAFLGDGYLFGNRISIQGSTLYYMTLGAFAGLTSIAGKP